MVSGLSKLTGKLNSNCVAVLYEMTVGNKNDREDRCVSTEEAKQLADDLKISFVETSAKDNCNVEQVSILL